MADNATLKVSLPRRALNERAVKAVPHGRDADLFGDLDQAGSIG